MLIVNPLSMFNILIMLVINYKLGAIMTSSGNITTKLTDVASNHFPIKNRNIATYYVMCMICAH